MACLVCIDTSAVGINQWCGKFSHISYPGLNWVCWPFQTVASVSTKVMPIDVTTQTKTKDNVTLTVRSSIQVSVDPAKADQYYFRLSNPHLQVTAHVDDCIRSALPALNLDEAFESKESMANDIKATVGTSMEPYGLIVHKALVTDMQADPSVLAAMNEINASRRQRDAAVERAEAEKILAVKAAEAEAEAKELSGIGVAKMRQAIMAGFKGSIDSMSKECGLEPREIVHMVLVTQYLDVLKDFAQSGKATMVIPHGPSAVSDMETQVRNGFMQASMLGPNTMQ
mmetsp:Transcript_55178/g.112888  ORF Transcript_55178/g.112888 Transcript_55178/m.112888 type:complete len:284 (-) Transcript_55178:279-1130(-)